MSFEPRLYPDIVRDLLTVLTGGTVAETHAVGSDGLDRLVLDHAPIDRVSHLEGAIVLGDGTTPYRFTERDFQLVGTPDRPGELSIIEFRKGGKRPAPNSTLRVNYYPSRRNKLTPINDVNVGSVARTLLETVAFELAAQYQQLGRVYRSAFVDTAEGSSLDRVSALVDVRRLRAGHAIGKVRFSRRASTPGDIFIPASTAVSDGKGARYVTSQDGSMLPNQTSIELWVQGETVRTKTVGPRELAVLERAIAGVDRVANDEATFRATEEERDDQLAQRARRAIHGTGRGTLDAIQFALESLSFVSAVTLTERPDGVPGTLRVAVALTEDNAFRRTQVAQMLLDYRPAGIAVDLAFAGKTELRFSIRLTLAGASAPTSVVAQVTDGVSERLRALVGGLKPGGVLRRSRVTAAVLDDARIVDAAVSITADATAVTQDNFTLPADRASNLDAGAVLFDQVTFERAAQTPGPRIIHVDVDLTIIELVAAPDPAALRQLARNKVEPLLARSGPGTSLTFEDVLAALREGNEAFAVVPLASALAIVEDTGAFTELRDGDAPFEVPAGATLRLRDVHLVEDAG